MSVTISIGSRIRSFDWYTDISDLEWPWTAQ